MNTTVSSQIGIIEAMILIDEYIWCVAGSFNALLKINMNTGKIYYMAEIPDEEIHKQRLYSDIQQYKNKLFFVPMAAKDIAVYNMQNGEFVKIKLKQPKKIGLYKEDYKFSKCIIYNSNAYLFNVSYPAIIKVNLDNYTIDYIDEWMNYFKLSEKNKEKVYFRNICREGNCIYLASCCSNIIIEFDLESEKIFVHKVGKENEFFSDIAFCDNKIYLSLLSENKVIILDKKNWIEIGRIETGIEISVSIEMKEWNNKIFYFPISMSEILIIENETVKNRINLKEDSHYNIFKVINNKKNCYFIPEGNRYIMMFSMFDYNIKKIPLYVDDKLKDLLIKKKIIIDERFIGIQTWITCIKKSIINKNEDAYFCTGYKIWKNIGSNK